MELFLAVLRVITLMAVITTVQAVLVDPKDIRISIKSECGDIIDCVDMHRQFPSLKEQLQKDHTNTMKLKREHLKLLDRLAERNYTVVEQTWRRNGSCPDGTVPIRRMPANVNSEFASHPNRSFRLFGRPTATSEAIKFGANGKEEIAAAYSVAGPYHGAYAAIPIWRTRVEPNEFSMSYLLIAGTADRSFHPIRGKDTPDTTYQIAVGMAVWPSVLGEDNSRFFVYYTSDGGVKSNCLNHDCGGFVQTSSKYALGTKFRDSDSQVGGQTYFIRVGIFQYPGEPVWRVSINGDELGHIQEGTFPVGFFESLHNEMGGRVLNTRPGGRHTMTQMGSGMFASSGTNNAATIASYMAVNDNGGDQPDDPVNTIVTSPKCYDVKNFGNDMARPGYDVAFGGPGGYYCDQ